MRQLLRLFMVCYLFGQRVAAPIRRCRPPASEGYDVLVTGTFHSANWALAHLRPLAMSEKCARVLVVSVLSVPQINKVEVIRPPAWLVKCLGAVPARMVTFAFVGLRERPHFIGGFHLLFNGLVAALVAPLAGARSIYFCVGGPMEIIGGGLWGNPLFARIGKPDSVIENQMIEAIKRFDIIITMGTRAVQEFSSRGIDGVFHVVPGGIDTKKFFPSSGHLSIDIILVARFDPIKRIDIFLRAVSLARKSLPELKVVIVGDGPLRIEIEALCHELELESFVTLVGQQSNVEVWLRKARLFALTSDSEGLALALMEAMQCGLPAVVSNVGDLADLVEDGVNGFLVSDRTPQEFAQRFVDVLCDPLRWQRFRAAAHASMSQYELPCAVQHWNRILGSFDTPRVMVPLETLPGKNL